MVTGVEQNQSTESSKTLNPDVKSMKESSLNEKEASFDASDGVGPDEDLKIVGLDGSVLGLEDSELYGVSSLLKMQRSGSLRRLESVLDVIEMDEKRVFDSGGGERRDLRETCNCERSDANENGEIDERSGGGEYDEEEDDVENESCEFEVGDFVWGKIRSHPWWPGRIYDPSGASDFAKSKKRVDKFLVAYFGDGTFAWCKSSQLKPFEENFEVLSKQSSSQNFVLAIEKALEEIGRLVDLKMTCSCVPERNMIGFGRTLAVNAGIKEGLLVPEGGLEKFSTALFDPVECFTALEGMAQSAIISNMLQFSVLKSWVAALYRARGGCELSLFHEAQCVRGLEDKTGNPVKDLSFLRGESEVVIQKDKHVEDESLPSSGGWKLGQPRQISLHKCQKDVESKSQQKRKQRSIAEIIGVSTDTEAVGKEGDLPLENTDSSKEPTLSEIKKRMVRGGVILEAAIVTEEAKRLQKPESSPQAKKRKAGDGTDGKGKNNGKDFVTAGTKSEKSASKFKGKNRKDDDEIDANGNAGSLVKKKRRKSTEAAENDVSGVAEKMDVGLSTGNNQGEASRGRKKSKYLSPPFANVFKARKRQGIEAETPEVFSEGKSMGRKASDQIIQSPLISSNGGERYKKKKHGEQQEKSDDSGLETPKQDHSNIIDPMKVNVPAAEVLRHLRATALYLMCMKENNDLEVVDDFFSAFRSSTYQKGSNYKAIRRKSGRKWVSRESELGISTKKQNQARLRSSDHKSKQMVTKSSVSEKNFKREVEQASSTSNAKAKKMESEKKVSAAALVVTFGPTSSLPMENDLIKIYENYGPLNLEETSVDGRCARIVFYDVSHAEDAFNNCQLANPFEKTHGVSFRLQYLSNEAKSEKNRYASTPKSSLVKEIASKKVVAKPAALQSSNCEVSQLSCIQDKLELLASMLENSDGKMSPNLKSKLEGEVKGLLEMVSSMTGT